MDDVHIYEATEGYQGGGYKSKIEAAINLNDQQDYVPMSLCDQQGQSEYQELQLCSMNTRKAADTCNDEVKGSSDRYKLNGQKDELKKMKRCLCVLSFLVVILFLITVSSLGLAAYYGSTLGSEAHNNEQLVALRNVANMLESRINTTSRDVASLASLTSTVKNNLESQLNTINSEVVSQRTLINNLESRLNGINSQISTLTPLRSSVISLESQLRMTNVTISSLQLAIRSQPRMHYTYM